MRAAVPLILKLILKFRTRIHATQEPQDAMILLRTGVATERSTGKGTHQAALALGRVRVTGVRRLVVSALLWELCTWCRRVLLVGALVILLRLVPLALWRGRLRVLEAALGWGSVSSSVLVLGVCVLVVVLWGAAVRC